MIEASCHCGAVRLVVSAAPEFLVDCNCSICRRKAALWAFYDQSAVQQSGHPENTVAYVWGDRSIRTLHCKTCGCTTHWEALDSARSTRVGLNARNFDPVVLQGIRVRKFDGANTWTYLD